MREFFTGWKRKIGVVTLFGACIVFAAWVRSLTEQDVLIRLGQKSTQLVISMDGALSWTRVWPIVKPRPSQWLYRHAKNYGLAPVTDMDFHWHLVGYGFECFAGSRTEATAGSAPYVLEFESWQIPYWSAASPLILLSAWLLLSKPRSAKPGQTHVTLKDTQEIGERSEGSCLDHS